MSHRSQPVSARPMVRGRLATLLTALLVAVMASGCGTPAATFSPTGPCLADGHASHVYPELEALLPPGMIERSPDTLDSGRTCSDAGLGSLVSHGVHELRSAGAIWDYGNGRATTSAILALPTGDLPVAWVEEFYEVGARTAKRTEQIATSRPTFKGLTVFRLDTLNDLSLQTVAVWAEGAYARVVIVATPVSASTSRAQHDEAVQMAVEVTAKLWAP